jgi:purine catabolism regulator
MIAPVSTFTLEEVLRLALPLGTMALAASHYVVRQVRWALTVNPDNALPYLEGGEVIILTPGKADLHDFIHACAEAGATAIVMPPPISPMALAAAEIAKLPILQLPANSNLRDVERAIISLLLDHQHLLEQRSTQVYQQLVQLASENIGLDKLIHELSEFVDKTVVVQDKHLRVLHSAVSPSHLLEYEEVAEWLADRRNVPTTLQDRHKLPRHTSPIVQQPLRTQPMMRLVAPIVTQSVGRGYLSFIGPQESFTDLDSIVLSHGAVVCALEMARAKAISEVEKRLRGDFLDSLMAGTVGETEAQAEGDRFGHDMTAAHVALVLLWYGPKHPSTRRLETLVNGMLSGKQISCLMRLREKEVRLFYAPESAATIQAARELAEEIRNEAKREHTDAKLAIGIGSVANRVNDWRASYREAAQAADICRRLQSETPMFIGDLGIYTFLARPDYRDDLRTLRDATIGNLLQYEERQRADLLVTLEAFFQCHGNHTQTAEQLSVHRNTLFYRMNRISEITGLDLNRPDVRLAVHLALKIHRLLTADS